MSITTEWSRLDLLPRFGRNGEREALAFPFDRELHWAADLHRWIAINSVLLLTRVFDPYPFILLNLILSCLAAVQAPVIHDESKPRRSARFVYVRKMTTRSISKPNWKFGTCTRKSTTC